MAQARKSYQKFSDEAQENPTASATSELQQSNAATGETKLRNKYKVLLYWFGVTEIILGIVSILLAISTLIIASRQTTFAHPYSASYYFGPGQTIYLDLSYYHGLTKVSQGIWAGAFLVVTGILEVIAKSKPSVCIYNVNMALSIIAANLTLALMVLSALAARTYPQDGNRSFIAIHSILAVIGFAAAAVCIVHSAYCCAGVCCRRPKPYQGPVIYAPQPHGIQQPQQMVQLANGQFILLPIQPVAASDYPGAPATTTYDMMPMFHQVPQGGFIVPPMNVQFPAMQPLASQMPSVQSVSTQLHTATAPAHTPSSMVPPCNASRTSSGYSPQPQEQKSVL